MLDVRTVNDIFVSMSSRGDAIVAKWKDANDVWQSITSKQMYGRVRALVEWLQTQGIKPGDRVALISENRWEWPVVDFAVLAMGAVNVPLYQTVTAEQLAYMMRDSGARLIFGSTREQYDKIVSAGEIPALERVIVLDQGQCEGADSFQDIMKRAPELEAQDAAFDAMVKGVKPEQLASIVYTSGTTGEPKGVVLTHNNLAVNLQHSTDDLNIKEGESSISFLPLSHLLARHLDYAMFGHHAVIAYLGKFDALPAAMKVIRPTIFLSVPRVFEKIRQGVEGKAHGFKKRIMDWSLKQGAKHKDEVAAGKTPSALGWKIAHKLVFSKIEEAFGGRARLFVSGGAPLGKENTDWFLGVGIRIFEGYGLTETSPVVARNTYAAYRPNTVGTVIPNLEVRLASDGELELHGPTVFSGYWQNEEASKKEFTEDGWFKTGDIVKLEDGFLSITDRKKELLKTSGGKYVAPQPIESKLKVDALVGQAALIGDQKKFVSVLISPNLGALQSWAKKNGVNTSDPKELAKDPKVKLVYEGLVKKVNGSLAQYESIKKVIVVPDEWSVESGELTPSLKLKRRVLNEKYKDAIAAIYRE